METCFFFCPKCPFTLFVDVGRKLEQDYKEKLSAVRSELTKEMDQMQQQAGLQREELEAEIQKIREEESLLRDHLSISVKVPKGSRVTLSVFILHLSMNLKDTHS